MKKDQISYKINVLGIVQGVGYRPFVVRLAKECNIKGYVKNIGGIVEISAVGNKEAMDNFIHRLELQKPPGANVLSVDKKEIEYKEYSDFTIYKSGDEKQLPIISPDLPTCKICEQELHDKNDRRYLYPFISCVSCGPRYSIIRKLPYDRCNVTMDIYPMCKECENEYSDLATRRCHAQTIACQECGPYLIWNGPNGEEEVKEKAYKKAVSVLKNSGIVAIKDIGGYHFACLADCVKAVKHLRQLKGREKKPFAVMFSDVKQIKEYCFVSSKEEQLLNSDPRPIVLLRKKKDFSKEVCGESLDIGAFLPCNPLQILLLEDCGPLVMTSANRSGEPIIIEDEKVKALKEKDSLLEGILYHTRQILTPLDDSVLRMIGNKQIFIRRARGYVPLPIILKQKSKEVIFAAGGDLKASFCLYHEDRAYLSQYFGDMEDIDVCSAYEKNKIRMEKLFHLTPKKNVCDMHPEYFTVKKIYNSNNQIIRIQHHHAHIASVIAEHGLEGRVLGIAFDGTGYGTDGAIWGGEFLLCEKEKVKRLGHLSYITLCGGDEAAKNADLVKNCFLINEGIESKDDNSSLIKAALDFKLNTFQTSSMGRLFDAVCAMLKIKDYNDFEGECAGLLENLAIMALEKRKKPYPMRLTISRENGMIIVSTKGLFSQIKKAMEEGHERQEIALGFHYALVDIMKQVCEIVKKEIGITQIALSGGVFLNRVLTEEIMKCLNDKGFKVYINEKVPIGDGGICLGQAYLAGLMKK
ncbi:carbamoyltransferase HypF [Anaerosacchariphilus polymeriproducens]|nr:carbamoyltransferase HypF [Anaerosacchariphilus polymeriproducens]